MSPCGGNAPVIDSTRNRLSQFDLAVALSQNAINNQLRSAWSTWLGDDAEFSTLRATARFAGADVDLEARLGAPAVDLNAPASRPDQVQVSMTIAGGVLRSAALGQVDLRRMRLTFTASLARRPVTIDSLHARDADMAEKTRAAIDVSDLPASVFSIECLYLDLTALASMQAVSLEQGGAAQTPTPDVVQAMQACLREMLHASDLLLHAVALPRRLERAPTFALRDFVNKATPCPANPQAATLDYLGVTWNGSPLPTDSAQACAAIGPWLDPSRMSAGKALVAGMLVLRGAQVTQILAGALRQVINDAYGDMHAANKRREDQGGVDNPGRDLPYPEAELFKNVDVVLVDNRIEVRSSDGCNHYEWTDDDVSYVLQKRLLLTFAPVPGAGYRVGGQVGAQLSRKRQVNFGQTSEAATATTSDIQGTFELRVGGAGLRCDLNPHLAITFLPPRQHNENNAGILNWLGLMNTDYDQRMVSGFAGDDRAAIQSMVTEILDRINISLGNFAIVPPGEDVFTFLAPRFSFAGDLVLDINYKGVLPQQQPQ